VEANSQYDSYDALENAYYDTLFNCAKGRAFRYFGRMLEASRNSNDPMRVCCLVEDCIARGKGLFEGGERYTLLQPIFVGFANVVDSLVAIKKLVYEEKRLSLESFLNIVHNNYEGNEALRQYIIQKLPHYGNDQVEADFAAKRLSDGLKKVFHSKILGGHIMFPGSFSYVTHAELGAKFGATFDGRKANYSYSDGCSPAQGRDTNGPTAMVLSLTSWDQSEFLGGMVVNIKFGAEHLSNENAKHFLQILRTFMRRGGLEMQVNVVDRNTLLDAREHPEAHGDLFVRIGGYSDYFVRLTPTLQ
jgi:formate C-acetyltransferase